MIAHQSLPAGGFHSVRGGGATGRAERRLLSTLMQGINLRRISFLKRMLQEMSIARGMKVPFKAHQNMTDS
jgi:hypothetical protein